MGVIVLSWNTMSRAIYIFRAAELLFSIQGDIYLYAVQARFRERNLHSL